MVPGSCTARVLRCQGPGCSASLTHEGHKPWLQKEIPAQQRGRSGAGASPVWVSPWLGDRRVGNGVCAGAVPLRHAGLRARRSQQPWVLAGCRGPSPARSNVPHQPRFVPLQTRSRSFAGCRQQPRGGNRVACLFAGSRKAPAILKAGFTFLEAARGCLYVLTLQKPLPLPSRPQQAGFMAGLCTRGEQSAVPTAPAATRRLWDPVWVENTSMLRLLLQALG